MSNQQKFACVWDALEDDPIRARNLQLRSDLMIRISLELRSRGMTQVQAAQLLGVTQPRICALLQGKIEQFRLDSLVDLAHRMELKVKIEVAA